MAHTTDYKTNTRGDVIGLYDANGTQICEYEYDAWGKLLSVTDMEGNAITSATHPANINPIRYRSYYYDNETKLYYVSSRYYDPEVGRWINADSTNLLGASPEVSHWDKNLFAYCDNNPVIRADIGGDFWHIIIGTAIGAITGGVLKVASNMIAGKPATDGLAVAMLSGAVSGALASTGIGRLGMAIGSAVISMAENATYQVIENRGFKNFDVGDMLIDGAIGGVSGALGGKGKGSKHMTNLGKQTVNRTVGAVKNNGIKEGAKEAGKAFAYYTKNTYKYYKTFKKDLPWNIFTSFFIMAVTHEKARSAYRSVLEKW